jgi:transposase
MSQLDRTRVIGLAAQGLPPADIIKTTGLNRSFVYRWASRVTTTDAPRSGRPLKLTKPVVKRVRRLMKV